MRVLLVVALLGLATSCFSPLARAETRAASAQESGAAPSTQSDPAQAAPSDPAPEMTPEDKRDAEIGKSAAEEIEKEYKLVEDSADLPRIAAIVDAIRPATQKPHQKYTVKVIDSSAINAFSLPGGYLYFTRAILGAVESDDELAAVTAHEMAHICLDHSRRLMSRDEKYKRVLGALLVASVLSSSEAVNSGAIATVGSLVAQDALNHYGREAEFEADAEAVAYLKAGHAYNPVAVLTVVEGLARMESSEGRIELGVYQTHPYGPERVQAVIARLTELGVPIERRRVTHSLSAEAEVAVENDREIGRLKLNGRVVFEPAAELDGRSAAARAESSAATLNDLLLANLQLLELAPVEDDGAVSLQARGQTILTITPGDADFHGVHVRDLTRQAMEAIQLGFREEKVGRAY